MKKRKTFLRLPPELKVERASAFSADVRREKHLPSDDSGKLADVKKLLKLMTSASELNGKKIIFHYVIYKNCKCPLSQRTGSQ